MECRKKMIKASLLFIFILFSAAITQESTPELYTPEIFQVNRAPAHNTSYVFQTVEQAKTGERENSDYYLSLNGNFTGSQMPPNGRKDFINPPMTSVTGLIFRCLRYGS